MAESRVFPRLSDHGGGSFNVGLESPVSLTCIERSNTELKTYLASPEPRTGGFKPFWSFRGALPPFESPEDCVPVLDDSNSAGMRGEKDERMEALRLSRSRAARVSALW